MKKIIYISITLLFSFIINLKVQAQDQLLKGQIYDVHTQESLAGIYVHTTDSSASAVSRNDGSFSLSVKSEEGVITFSAIGYKSQKSTFDKYQKDFRIFMEPVNISLNEVVVKSFNSHKKNKYTPGAISTISQARIRQGNEVSLQSAFNSVPGVKMDQSTLSEARVSIRGSGVRSPWVIRNCT